MSRVEKEVKTFVVRLYCDNFACGKEMLPTGKVVSTIIPMKYEYKCPNCGNVVIEENVYPLVVYKEV